MEELVALYRIDPEDFNLTQDAFDHQSKVHGVGHVYRVMYHCLRLGLLLNKIEEARLAFFAAYLHDLCRKHDGRCIHHGLWAAESKLPLYADLFIQQGASLQDLEMIKTAITWHSEPEELPAEHPSWNVTSLLKDADALDRIRLGENDLDPNYLRFELSKTRIGLAKDLYFASYGKPISRFAEIISEGDKVDSVPKE